MTTPQATDPQQAEILTRRLNEKLHLSSCPSNFGGPCPCEFEQLALRSAAIASAFAAVRAEQAARSQARIGELEGERDAEANRANLADAYMMGMRAACGQPTDRLPEPYQKGRLNYEYQEGLRLARELLDVFAHRTDRAQDRAAALESRITTLEQALREAQEGLTLITTLAQAPARSSVPSNPSSTARGGFGSSAGHSSGGVGA